eukprot:m.240992 g.240992  ORF g.240992 m.240992 type:complete len:262 (-) comp16084_c0_seq2:115-900(-)
MWMLCFLLLFEGLSALSLQEDYKPPVDFEEAKQRPVIFEEYHQQWRQEFFQAQMRGKKTFKQAGEKYNSLRSSLIEQLTLIKEVLGKCGITWWADAGTALAVHRDGILFPWEYDADIGLFSADALQLPSCVLSVYGHGKPIPYRNVTFLIVTGPDKSTLAARTFHGKDGYWGFVDFIVFEKLATKISYQRGEGKKPFLVPLTSLLPLEERKFETLTVFTPNNLPVYLHSYFGHDLGVPGDKKGIWERFLQRRSQKHSDVQD